MNPNTLLIAASSLLALVSPIVYIKAILRGKASPHRTTRVVLLINTILATTSLFIQQDTTAIWLAAISTLQSIIIFSLSLKYGSGGWVKIDIICLIIAILGIFLWKTTENPSIALYAAILSDFVGMVPTLIKTYINPKSEIWQFWMIDTFAGLFSLLAIRSWTPAKYSYPLYIMIINLCVSLLALFPKKQISITKLETN